MIAFAFVYRAAVERLAERSGLSVATMTSLVYPRPPDLWAVSSGACNEARTTPRGETARSWAHAASGRSATPSGTRKGSRE
jgi:hypothetical protein